MLLDKTIKNVWNPCRFILELDKSSIRQKENLRCATCSAHVRVYATKKILRHKREGTGKIKN